MSYSLPNTSATRQQLSSLYTERAVLAEHIKTIASQMANLRDLEDAIVDRYFTCLNVAMAPLGLSISIGLKSSVTDPFFPSPDDNPHYWAQVHDGDYLVSERDCGIYLSPEARFELLVSLANEVEQLAQAKGLFRKWLSEIMTKPVNGGIKS